MSINIQNLRLSNGKQDLFVEECGSLLETFLQGCITEEFTDLEWNLLKMSKWEITPYVLCGFKIMSKYLILHDFYLDEVESPEILRKQLCTVALDGNYEEQPFNKELDACSQAFVDNSYIYSKQDFHSAAKQIMMGESIALAAYELSDLN